MTDTKRNRQAGLDTDGEVRRLGEVDSMGYRVGWIDEDGTCWESERERNISIATGRWLDERKRRKLRFQHRNPSKIRFAVKATTRWRDIPAILQNMKREERFWDTMLLAWARNRAQDDLDG